MGVSVQVEEAVSLLLSHKAAVNLPGQPTAKWNTRSRIPGTYCTDIVDPCILHCEIKYMQPHSWDRRRCNCGSWYLISQCTLLACIPGSWESCFALAMRSHTLARCTLCCAAPGTDSVHCGALVAALWASASSHAPALSCRRMRPLCDVGGTADAPKGAARRPELLPAALRRRLRCCRSASLYAGSGTLHGCVHAIFGGICAGICAVSVGSQTHCGSIPFLEAVEPSMDAALARMEAPRALTCAAAVRLLVSARARLNVRDLAGAHPSSPSRVLCHFRVPAFAHPTRLCVSNATARWTPLHRAAAANNVEAAKLLIECQVPPLAALPA
eukprot:3337643-Rhodomonas_salina.1